MPNNPRGVHASETRYDLDGFPIRTGSVADIKPLIDADWPPPDGRVLDGWVAVGAIAEADVADLTAVISAADIVVLSRDFIDRNGADSAGHANGGVRRTSGSSRSSGRANPRPGRRSDSPIRREVNETKGAATEKARRRKPGTADKSNTAAVRETAAPVCFTGHGGKS